MNALSIPRPQATAASFHFFTFCSRVLQLTTRRHTSSYKRTRSRLNVKPDPSFLPSKTHQHDHIIFNPPPSPPNVLHTPTLFLPKTDPRYPLQSQTVNPQLGVNAGSSVKEAPLLPPPIRDNSKMENRVPVTQEQLVEMRKLRKEDPWKWSNLALQKKYDCSHMVVTWATKGGFLKEKAEQQKAVTEFVKSRWGKIRRVAREDRALRKERWFRDA